MKTNWNQYVGKIVVYYSLSKGDILVGHAKQAVNSKTAGKGLLVHDFITNKTLVLRKEPKILTLELYELQNRLRYRVYFLLKILGYMQVNHDIINRDVTIKDLLSPEAVMELEMRLNGAIDVVSSIPEESSRLFQEFETK